MIEEFLASERGLVVAAAGCGKTHLLVEAVKRLPSRQLLLTHTNAGVRELRRRLEKEGVPPDRFSLKTIDSFCFGYVAAYPKTSGWSVSGPPTAEEWSEVKVGFVRLIQEPFVQEIVRASYSGLLVDEYQDCSVIQHEIVTALSSILPTRVVGDPLQGIFDFGTGRDSMIEWSAVTSYFSNLGELTVPHRWKESNALLGSWISDSRERIATGQASLGASASVTFKLDADWQEVLRHLNELAHNNPRESIAVIFPKQRSSCRKLAGKTRNRFEVMEDADCKSLVEDCRVLDEAIARRCGADVLKRVTRMAKEYIASLPPDIEDWCERTVQGRPPRPRRADYQRISAAMSEVLRAPDIASILAFHASCEECPGISYKSRESWRTFRKVLSTASAADGRTLEQVVKSIRTEERAMGRRPPHRCISTTLLLKGLEFEHVVIAQLGDYGGLPLHLYVAISRAKKSLTIFKIP